MNEKEPYRGPITSMYPPTPTPAKGVKYRYAPRTGRRYFARASYGKPLDDKRLGR